MLRQSFEQELNRLQSEVLALGDTVQQNIIDSVTMLKERDFEGSRRLIAADRDINRKRNEIEMDCLTLIATQQPLAGDLRVIAAMLAIAGELERMNDYTKGIARINLMIGEEPLLKPLIDIPRMAEKARDMLYRSLDAFARRDANLAQAIPAQDDEVDELYNKVFHELMTLASGDVDILDRANYLLWAAHNLERTADRVTNICERVVFMVTGELVELNHKDDTIISGQEGQELPPT
jgi:phosphate transport system protein